MRPASTSTTGSINSDWVSADLDSRASEAAQPVQDFRTKSRWRSPAAPDRARRSRGPSRQNRDHCFRTTTCAPKDRSWERAGSARHTAHRRHPMPPRSGDSPTRVPRRNRPIQHGQDALIRLGRVFRFRSAIAGLIKAGPSIGGVAHSPFRRRAGVQPTARPIARLATPSAATSTIRARWRSRYSVLVERANASSSVRSASVSMIGVASGMPCMHP